MHFPARIGLCALLVCGSPGLASPAPLAATVESSLGDLIELGIDQETSAPARTIKTCLIDISGGAAKGFDIREGQPPRYVTSGREPVCAELAPVRHQLLLWRARLGQLRPVVSMPLDLWGRAGQSLWIIWRKEGAAPRPQPFAPAP